MKDVSLLGCTVLDENVFSNLIKHIEKGSISPLIAATYPLENIVEAKKAFIEKNHTGKIILEVKKNQ